MGDVLCFYRFEALAIIGENEDVLVGTVDIADLAAGATGVGEHHAAIDAAWEGAETDGGDVGGERGWLDLFGELWWGGYCYFYSVDADE